MSLRNAYGDTFGSVVGNSRIKLCRNCVHKTRTTPCHPESDGLVERCNRTLLMMLAMFSGDDWDDLLNSCLAKNARFRWMSVCHGGTRPARSDL